MLRHTHASRAFVLFSPLYKTNTLLLYFASIIVAFNNMYFTTFTCLNVLFTGGYLHFIVRNDFRASIQSGQIELINLNTNQSKFQVTPFKLLFFNLKFFN